MANPSRLTCFDIVRASPTSSPLSHDSRPQHHDRAVMLRPAALPACYTPPSMIDHPEETLLIAPTLA
jgi:hypothetical protein